MDLPEVFLLDLDDTILDSYGNPDDAWSSICLRFAGRMSGVNPQQMQGAISDSRDLFWADESRARRGRLDLHGARREIVRRAFTRLGIAPGPLADEMADRFRHHRRGGGQALAGCSSRRSGSCVTEAFVSDCSPTASPGINDESSIDSDSTNTSTMFRSKRSLAVGKSCRASILRCSAGARLPADQGMDGGRQP